jgi:hypothetical protein
MRVLAWAHPLVVILGLMTVSGNAQNQNDLAPPPKLPQMVRWSDPTERAFTVSVPTGWRITGGTHRNAPIDARNYVDAESPDGKIKVWVNDPSVLPRQEPHPLYYRLGWYEGHVVQGPAGPMMIERFKSGVQFAQEFTAQKQCSGAQMLSAFDLNQETQRMNAAIASLAARVGAHEQSSAGEITYRCGERSGYTYAITIGGFIDPQGPHIWGVEKLAGYLSDRSTLDVARYVMNAMISSFQIDPAWQAQYEQQIHDTTGALMEISNRITQTSMQMAQQSMEQNMKMVQQRQRQFDQMSQSSTSSFQRQQESQDRNRQRWSDITLGQIHGCDDIGNCTTVSNDYQNYWTKDGRAVVGGPSDGSPPGPEYHKWTPDY